MQTRLDCIAFYRGGRPAALLCCVTDGVRIRTLYRVLNPDKLRAVPDLTPDA